MKTIFLIILLLFVSSLTFQESYACSCIAPIDYVQTINESEYAFVGTVSHIDNSDGPQKVQFDVITVLKGDIPDGIFVLDNTNIIRNGEMTTHSTCDVGYQLGVTYNVFVYDNVHMNNGMCSTKAVGSLGILNPLDYNLFYYFILGIIVVVVMGIVVWKKRK